MAYQNSYGKVVHCAIINDRGEYELVDWRTHRKWARRKPGKPLEAHRIGRQRISIIFVGRSEVREGEPPTFWHVSLEPGRGFLRRKPKNLPELFEAEVSNLLPEPFALVRAKTLDDALLRLRQGHSVIFEVACSSMESAQAACQKFVAAAKEGLKQRKLLQRDGYEKTQELLAREANP